MYEMRALDLTNPGDVATNRQGQVSPRQLSLYAPTGKPSPFLVLFSTFMFFMVIEIVLVNVVRIPEFGIHPFFLMLLAAGFGSVLTTLWTKNRREQNKQKWAEGTVEAMEGEVQWTGGRFVAQTPGRLLQPVFGRELNLLPGRYRFYVLAETNSLLSAEALEAKVAAEFEMGKEPADDSPDLLSILANVHHFSIASLEDNRAGRFSPPQRTRLRRLAVLRILGVILMAGTVVGLPIFLQARLDLFVPVGLRIIMFIVVGFILIVFGREISHAFNVWKDKLEFLDGHVQKFVASSYSSETLSTTSTYYYYGLGGMKWLVSHKAYEALVEGISYGSRTPQSGSPRSQTEGTTPPP